VRDDIYRIYISTATGPDMRMNIHIYIHAYICTLISLFLSLSIHIDISIYIYIYLFFLSLSFSLSLSYTYMCSPHLVFQVALKCKVRMYSPHFCRVTQSVHCSKKSRRRRHLSITCNIKHTHRRSIPNRVTNQFIVASSNIHLQFHTRGGWGGQRSGREA